MLSDLVAALPASVIRGVGRLQHRIPILGPAIGWVGRRVLAGQGTIRHGIGAGLRFDARGGASGFLFGTTEPHEQALLARYLKPGGVFYDIGANVGFFVTLAGRLVGKDGRVYAFEPNPVCATQVRRNAGLNDFGQVEVVETAVSSASGRTRLHFGDTSGVSRITAAAQGRVDGGVDVALTTIDEFVRARSARAPDLVMIDVEGAEIEVLKGMHETIRAHKPVIVVEVHWIGDQFLPYCREHIVPLGYSLQPLEGDDFPPHPNRFHAVMVPAGRPALR